MQCFEKCPCFHSYEILQVFSFNESTHIYQVQGHCKAQWLSHLVKTQIFKEIKVFQFLHAPSLN